MSTSSSTVSSDVATNLANMLPTGTFLVFQTVAPLFSNNGVCGTVEQVMTGILTGTFAAITILLTFTDSITTSSGKVYYGIVTTRGLFNPQFNGSGIAGVNGSYYSANPKDDINVYDFVNSILGVTVFGVLALLTEPVSECFFPSIPGTITKSVPILVGLLAAVYFSFAPPPRRGVGFAITGLVQTVSDNTTASNTSASKTTVSKDFIVGESKLQSLLTPEERKAVNAATQSGKSPV